jgi:hypothetical protein
MPYEHRAEPSVLLAVDQQLGEGATLRVAPELSDPVGSLEVGQHEDAEQLGAGSGAEGVQALPESAFELIASYGREATPFHRRPVYRRACPGTFTNAGAPRQSLS